LSAPAGVKVEELGFPPAKDFTLKGTDTPLAVFEGAFPIEVRLAIAKDHPAGEVTVPARLRYQACDDTTCCNDDPSADADRRGGSGRCGRAPAAPSPAPAADGPETGITRCCSLRNGTGAASTPIRPGSDRPAGCSSAQVPAAGGY
jgi:hypothetical protein